jgi:hypothetical protein
LCVLRLLTPGFGFQLCTDSAKYIEIFTYSMAETF